jgi:uncharacterized protein (TIGR02996 family)
MNDLAAFLEAVRKSGDDDTPRLAFADWLDERHPDPVVRRGELPKGFNGHWHQNAMYATLGVRDMARGRGKWSNADILAGLAASTKAIGVTWAAGLGASEIGGYPVLISDSTLRAPRVLEACRDLQWAAGGCPVSFNRRDDIGHARIIIWFTALPSDEQSMRETADAIERAFGGSGRQTGESAAVRVMRRIRNG